jgi:uncharacterized protein YbjT (DUF2867 family)
LRVFLTGGTGFVGTAVVRELVGRGFGATALVRDRAIDVGGDVTSVKGDLFDANVLDAAMVGSTTVVHLVGIIAEKPSKGVTFDRIHVEGTKAVVEATQRAGIRRYVHMSALGTRPNAVSEYHKTKWRAEEYVRASGLDWTIFRPSLIHGPDGEFTGMEVAWARKRKAPWLFMPYFGRGALGTGRPALVQPIFVDDVARAFVDAIEKPKSIGKTYEIAGAQRLTWPQMHAAFARAVVGKSRATMAVPAWYAKALTRVVPAGFLPFNRVQVQMGEEDNTVDLTPFVADFGWTPRALGETLPLYASRLGG